MFIPDYLFSRYLIGKGIDDKISLRSRKFRVFSSLGCRVINFEQLHYD